MAAPLAASPALRTMNYLRSLSSLRFATPSLMRAAPSAVASSAPASEGAAAASAPPSRWRAAREQSAAYMAATRVLMVDLRRAFDLRREQLKPGAQ